MSEQSPYSPHNATPATWTPGDQLQPLDEPGNVTDFQQYPAQQYSPQNAYGYNAGGQSPAGMGHPYAPMPQTTPSGVPAPFGYEPSTGLPYSDKSKVVAGVLQILLGGLGVGRFYKGDVGIGILQILVTVCTLGFGWLWPLIDGIVMLTGRPTDKQGRPLRS